MGGAGGSGCGGGIHLEARRWAGRECPAWRPRGGSRLEAHGWPVEGPSWRPPDEVTRVGPRVEVSGRRMPHVESQVRGGGQRSATGGAPQACDHALLGVP